MRLLSRKMTKMIFLSGLFLLLISASSFAQEFPKKPINFLIAVGIGSPQDVITRILLSKSEKFLGQPFVATTNGTGGGSVALGIVAKARPDGYQLVCSGSPMLIMVPQVRPVTFKLSDFAIIMQFGASQYGLAVKADSPWKTLKEFVEYARKNPGKVTYGAMEVGTLTHMAMEYIAKQEGIQWTHIPYPGVTTSALLGGHVTAESTAAASFVPHVKAGTVRVLVTYGERRMKSLPDVPTLRELGYDYGINNVYVVAAPKGTPAPIIKQLDDALHKAMNEPEFLRAAEKLEVDVAYRNSEGLRKYLEENYIRYGKLIKDFNVPKEGEKK